MSPVIRPVILLALCASTTLGCDAARETASSLGQQARALASEVVDAGVEVAQGSPSTDPDDSASVPSPPPVQAAAQPAAAAAETKPESVAHAAGADEVAKAEGRARGNDEPETLERAPAEPEAKETTAASCLNGTFTTTNVDAVLAQAVRRQARYRRPTRVTKASGSLRLSIDTNSNDVTVKVSNARGHYRVRLAGIPVDYRLHASVRGAGKLEQRDDHLSLVWDEPVKLKESVQFGETPKQVRSVALGLDNDYRFECTDDSLKLFAKDGERERAPLVLRRARETS